MRLLRLKKPGLEVVEINIASIETLEIIFDDEIQEYALLVYTKLVIHILFSGSFDECHMKLNKIHNAIDGEMVDI